MVCASCGHRAAQAFKFCPECGAPAAPAPAAREQRKIVTVLFCDVTGSTALGDRIDPEPLRALLARYFERMKTIVERHGGTVEKFIGDAVMAVFGVPVLHEDDALRAVRAAAEMRDALPALGVEGRIGVTTGEVVTGTAERLATGDPVNVAARLEQAAQPGEVLLGAETLALVRRAVEVEEVEPLALKGKAEPVAAYRLLAVTGEARHRLDAPMVGRERQRRLLAGAWEAAVGDRSVQLFTILGPAGVGKSRLAAEFIAAAGEDARVVTSRCLPYGDGITYWPVVEILLQLLGEDAAASLAALGVEDAAAHAVLALLGQHEAASGLPDETAWAVRKVLEAEAARLPLVAVVDDLHWGEPTFLDLVEHVADWSRDAPILLLCLARPELLDRRAGWAGGKMNAATLLLEPLSEAETAALVDHLLPAGAVDEGVRERILTAAEGNPLFVEEMVALLDESGGRVDVPRSIHVLLAARLDQLAPAERAVLECAAVEGKIFHRGAVQALAPDEPHVDARLEALVRKELLRPERARLAGEHALRFRHLLIRDAAYEAVPKTVRAELHERFADWLESRGPTLVELDEIVGYHLEQAYRYRDEVGTLDGRREDLGSRAGDRLAAAGARALARSDMPAAARLLERALALLPVDHRLRDEVRLELGEALSETDLVAAVGILGQLIDDATAGGADRIAWRARVARLHAQLLLGEIGADEAADVAEAAAEALSALGDEGGLARAWSAAAGVQNVAGDTVALAAAMQRALEHARRAGDSRLQAHASFWIGGAAFFGATPVRDGVALCEQLVESATTQLQRANATMWLGALQGLDGRLDEGRAGIAAGRALSADLGRRTVYGGSAQPHAYLELLAGDAAAAERILREGSEMLEQTGEKGIRSTVVALLAEALYRQRRYDEAAAAADDSEELTATDDVVNRGVLGGVRAKLLARQGRLAEAEALAKRAVETLEPVGNPLWLGDAVLALAEVHQVACRPARARRAAERAILLFEHKGARPAAERARMLLAALDT